MLRNYMMIALAGSMLYPAAIEARSVWLMAAGTSVAAAGIAGIRFCVKAAISSARPNHPKGNIGRDLGRLGLLLSSGLVASGSIIAYKGYTTTNLANKIADKKV